MTRLADRNPEGEDPKGLRAEHESGGAAEQQAPNSLFLKPNIDHAVGGVREAIAQALAMRFIERGKRRGSGTQWSGLAAMPKSYSDDFYEDADAVLAALSAPQQPVKLDAVREDALILSYFVCPACMCRGFARVQTADLQETDDVRCVGCKRVYSLPLATPPLDNTGLDAATDDLCDDCPPVGYPTDKTRCLPCPRRALASGDRS